MLTKGQKFWLVFIAVLSLLLGLVMLVPFKSVSSSANIFNVEMMIKLVAIPLIILLISVFPNKLKYIQVKGYREQSRIVSVISYFPAVVYLCALIGESIYLLAQGYVLNGSAPLGTIPWNLWYVALIVDLVIFMIAIHIFPRYEMQLDVKEHIILDACVFVLMICFGLMFLLVSKGTHEIFLAAGQKADPLLLCLYILAVIGFIVEIYFVAGVARNDEVDLDIRLNDLSASSFAARAAEYNRAYNDIMANFEDYFAEEGEIDVQEVELAGEQEVEEEAEQEAPAEEVVEEAPTEETSAEEVEEAPVDAVAEVEPEEDQELLAKKQEIDELEAEIEALRQAKEQKEQEAAEAEAARIAAREEAARLAEEKALKAKEEMQPTFKKLVTYAKGLEGVSCIENPEKRTARFLLGKKVFLIMNDTDKDYRLQFVNDPLKVVGWWNENSEIRPRSNKVDNWFKLTNKGTFTEELLLEIIDSSREFMLSEQERIAAEKKAQRAAARQAAKEAKEKEQAKAEANK